MTQDHDLIGTGWSFPPAFNEQTGSVETLNGEDDINSSLHILLSTALGERIMLPEYGCDLKQFLFASLDASKEAYIQKLVEEAILYFEARIKVSDIFLKVADGSIEITIEYTIKTTDSRNNFVYVLETEGR